MTEIFLDFQTFPNLDISILLNEIKRCKARFGGVEVKYTRKKGSGILLVGTGFSDQVIREIRKIAKLACDKSLIEETNKNENTLVFKNEQEGKNKNEKEVNSMSENKNDFMSDLQQATLGLGSVIQNAIAKSIEEGKHLQKELEAQNKKQREEHQQALKRQQEEHKTLLENQRRETEKRFSEHLKRLQEIENNTKQALETAIKPLTKRIEASETRAAALEENIKTLSISITKIQTAMQNFASEELERKENDV